jgi:hypothetical protein
MNTATKNPISSEEISRVVRLARETIRLDLLADIEATIDALTALSRNFREMHAELSALEARFASSPVHLGVYLGPDFQKVSCYEEAETTLKACLPCMIVRRASIDRDKRLTQEHQESLHDAYEDALTAVAELHEEIQAVRRVIIGHDLAAEPREDMPVFDTVEALIADLRK